MQYVLLIWKYGPDLIVAFCGVALVYRDWRFFDRRTTLHRTVTRLLIVFSLFSVVCSFGYKIYDSRNTQHEMDEQREWTRGPHEVPRFSLREVFGDGSSFVLYAENPADLPIQNVRAVVHIVNDLSLIHPALKGSALPADATVDDVLQIQDGAVFDVGTLNPNENRKVGRFHSMSGFKALGDKGAVHVINVQFTTLNGSGLQTYVYYRVNEEPAFRSELIFGFRDSKSLWVERTSSPNFPDKKTWDRPKFLRK